MTSVTAAVTDKRHCDGCGKRFRPGRSDARYCSSACRQRAYRARALEPTEDDMAIAIGALFLARELEFPRSWKLPPVPVSALGNTSRLLARVPAHLHMDAAEWSLDVQRQAGKILNAIEDQADRP